MAATGARYPAPLGPRTCKGRSASLVVPLPNSPSRFAPQSQTVPSLFITICSEPPPPHIETMRGEELVGFCKISMAPVPAAIAGLVKLRRQSARSDKPILHTKARRRVFLLVTCRPGRFQKRQVILALSDFKN